MGKKFIPLNVSLMQGYIHVAWLGEIFVHQKFSAVYGIIIIQCIMN